MQKLLLKPGQRKRIALKKKLEVNNVKFIKYRKKLHNFLPNILHFDVI